ncbi:MAG: hypothetical protein CL983_01230 [Euryarchaeota archaeon]|mgnify:FL=1|nr:hypothetical protein [Euryarchaeota archaeon]
MYRRATVPARINIIGEHTDYEGGLSLPFTINSHLTLEVKKSENDFSGEPTVIKLWKAAGGGPADLQISSDIPIGKGMSSSAALCLAVILCAKELNNPLEICKEAQRIEHEVLKTPCGLLDQMAMMFAKKGKATLINFSDYSVEYLDLPNNWHFKLVDSEIHRSLSSTNYNKKSDYLKTHVIEENSRVKKALNASAEELGVLLNQSHESLKLLGVSLPEIDEKIKSLQSTKGVYGARMMGGGFGGMILTLVENPEILPDYPLVSSSGSAVLKEFF